MKAGRSFAGMMMAAVLSWPVLTVAQTSMQDEKPSITNNAGNAAAIPLDQLVTKTVHEAWVDSGRNEDKFFAMVQELAELSARNRGVTLPDTQEAGVKFGEGIKNRARRDPDQLLYAVVDYAVHSIGKTQTAATAPSSSK